MFPSLHPFLELPKMGRLELFSLENEVCFQEIEGCFSLTHTSDLETACFTPKNHKSYWNSSRRDFTEKKLDSIHAITHPCRKLMTEEWDQEGILLSSIHAINHPMTAIHDEEKGMGIQLPSVKVREVGPAWKPRLGLPSVRKVL